MSISASIRRQPETCLLQLRQFARVCAVFGVPFRRKTNVLSLATQRFYAMLVKHAIHSWRNRVVTIVQLLLPVSFAIIACLVTLAIRKRTDPPPLPLDLSYFNDPLVPFTATGPGPKVARLADSYSQVADIYGQPVRVEDDDIESYLLNIANRSLDDYNRLYFVAATANNSGNGSNLVGHFNNLALHSIAISLSLVDNAVLRYAVPGDHHIVTVNHPLPRSDDKRAEDTATDALTTGFVFSTNVAFGLAFLVGSFAVFVVNQRANGAKHSQFVSGVDANGYWLAAFVWDLACFAVPSVLIVVVVLAFQTDAYSEWPIFG